MNDNLMETRHLSNGTTLKLYDVSRRQGADRWIVTMEARLDIPVTEDTLPPEPMGDLPLALRALRDLIDNDIAYRCNCSRKTLSKTAQPGTEGPIYPGTCLRSPPPPEAEAAWRIRVNAKQIAFVDRVCGALEQRRDSEIGDFVIRRVDGFTAYQLAVVVDDDDQGITDVVRGADLLWSTPRQLWLQQQLSLSTPRYAHVPLIYGADGRKLSKRDRAHPIDENDPIPALEAAWRHLGQQSPGLRFEHPDEFWQWAIPRWHIDRVPRDPGFHHD